MRQIVNEMIEFIKDNKKILEKINQEDYEIFAFHFEVNQLIAIFENYKNETVKPQNTKKILVSHEGNPYITAMICMEAILHKTEVIVEIEEVCYGLNLAIIKMVNDILKDSKNTTKVLLQNAYTNQGIQDLGLDKIVCLGNTNTYMSFKKVKDVEVIYVPFYNISVYYDSEEYEELVENMRYFAQQNLYEIEIFDETEDFEDVIYSINHSLTKHCAVILSQDKQKQEVFRQNVNSKIVCVNKNPFKEFEFKILEEIF